MPVGLLLSFRVSTTGQSKIALSRSFFCRSSTRQFPTCNLIHGESTVTMFIYGVCALPIGRIIIGDMNDGTGEALQETFQQTMGNLIAQELYDPERDTFTGAAKGAAVGFTVGDIFSTLGSMLTGSGRRGRRVGKDFPPPAAEPGDDEIVLAPMRGVLGLKYLQRAPQHPPGLEAPRHPVRNLTHPRNTPVAPLRAPVGPKRRPRPPPHALARAGSAPSAPWGAPSAISLNRAPIRRGFSIACPSATMPPCAGATPS